MARDNVIDFKRSQQEEDERALFGGEIYKRKHELPTIQIDNEHMSKYQQYLINLEDMGSTFTAYIYRLYAEVCHLYEIKDIDDLEDPLKGFIQRETTHSIGKIGNAMIQIKRLRIALEDKESYMMEGHEYCFIPIMLQDLQIVCNLLSSCIFARRYLDKELMDCINVISTYLISNGFEEMRQAFKVLECFDVQDKILELTYPLTVH